MDLRASEGRDALRQVQNGSQTRQRAGAREQMRSFTRLLAFIASFAFISLLFAPVGLRAQNSYDRDEEIRRAAEKLDRIEKDNQRKAAERYDAKHPSTSGESANPIGSYIFGGICTLFGVGVFYSCWNQFFNDPQQNKTENQSGLVTDPDFNGKKKRARRKSKKKRGR